jgi:hypothetical protein
MTGSLASAALGKAVGVNMCSAVGNAVGECVDLMVAPTVGIIVSTSVDSSAEEQSALRRHRAGAASPLLLAPLQSSRPHSSSHGTINLPQASIPLGTSL